jgi:hypothetical protein
MSKANLTFADLSVGERYTTRASDIVYTKISPTRASWVYSGQGLTRIIAEWDGIRVERVIPTCGSFTISDSVFTNSHNGGIKITTNDYLGTTHYSTIANIKENKMNKVYEGILVKVEDGEITGLHIAPDGTCSTTVELAKSPQRARDLMVRSLSEEITEVELNGYDWDIIVREFK